MLVRSLCTFLFLPVAVGATQIVPSAWQVEQALEPRAVRSAAATHASRITIDAQALRRAEQLQLHLPGGAVHTVQVNARTERGGGDFTLSGALAAGPEYTVTLTMHAGLLAGLVTAPEGNYEVSPLADGGQSVFALDQAAFPECAGGDVPEHVPDAAVPAAVTADPPNRIELLVMYSPQALEGAGGVTQIRTLAQAAVDAANTAFRNSDMVARFVLLDVRPVTRDEDEDDLNWIVNNAEVARIRNEVGADLVSLIVESSLDGCGVAKVMRNPGPGFANLAYQVTKRSCAVGNLSFAHEHGHNMGMEHNPEDGTDQDNASYDWSYGHYVSGSYRTVMSYSDPCSSSCPRRPYFSNPAVTFNGVPTGIAGARDNHRTGNLTAPIVANFRPSERLFANGFN
ncbi:M12 family metallo-peptidase [Tahibacter amnicola]|uniref:M12 family metallo-peptidase n=1 Tax=Tahibacter amnicola TaxID=2976241 RepID=A0ABY6BKT2_9GAMM|nr:M12 family metallo-peptidase [Tahibacter amnicola]UXI70087.1 M12 family metallo-peptidase [Tahibacter amnicola]